MSADINIQHVRVLVKRPAHVFLIFSFFSERGLPGFAPHPTGIRIGPQKKSRCRLWEGAYGTYRTRRQQQRKPRSNIRARGTWTAQNGGTDATFLTATTRGLAHRGRNYLKKLDTGPMCAPPLEMSPRENGRLSGRCGHVASCRLLFEFLFARDGSHFPLCGKTQKLRILGVAGIGFCSRRRVAAAAGKNGAIPQRG